MLRHFITDDEEAAILAALDDEPWDTTIHRRTQHYGARFDYARKRHAHDAIAPTLPEWLRWLCSRLDEAALVPWGGDADQVTVQEYKPGHGISAHVDTHSAFEDGIVAISLGSGCVMRMSRTHRAAEYFYVPPRSVLAFVGESRYAWLHQIAMRKTDVLDGERVARGRRVSITLRRILRSGRCTCGFDELCDSRGAALELPTRLRGPAAPKPITKLVQRIS